MTHIELNELGFETIAVDTNSFVSKTSDSEIWLEVFYSKETDYLQIMRVNRGNKGEIIRTTLLEGNGNIDYIKQFLK